MKHIGLLGGLTWHSTQEYYKKINEFVDQSSASRNGADISIRSLRFDVVQPLIEQKRTAELTEIIDLELKALKSMGAEIFGIACNSVHNSIDGSQFIAEYGGAFVHIADEPLSIAQDVNAPNIGLLSTMHSIEFWRSRARTKDIEIAPPNSEGIADLDSYIFDHLVHGRVLPQGQELFNSLCHKFLIQDIRVVALACTELFLFDLPKDITFLDTTDLHAKRIARIALDEIRK